MMSKWAMDTFGSMLPANWEEICEAANAYIDERLWMSEDEQAELASGGAMRTRTFCE